MSILDIIKTIITIIKNKDIFMFSIITKREI